MNPCSVSTVGVATGIDKRNPGTFLKGLCGGRIALVRADHCPAKGQPLQESFGVFLLGRPDRSMDGITSRTADPEWPQESTQAAPWANARTGVGL